MANRYWVGGSGAWNASSTTNWSATSGGSSGASIPTLLDDVIVDSNSGSPIITTSSGINAKSITTTGATCEIASTGTLSVNGNITLSSTTTWSATGTLSVGNCVLTTNGVVINAASISATSSNVTLNGSLTTSSATAVLLSGSYTLDLTNSGAGNYTLTVGRFVSTGAGVRVIAFGTGNITTIGSTTPVFNMSGTNLTYTGTPTININNNSATATSVVAGTAFTETNCFNFNIISGTYTLTLSSGFTAKSLNFTGFAGTWSPSTALANFYGSVTLVSGMTFNTGTGTWNFLNTSGVATITSAGKTVYSILQNGAGGTVSLADNLVSTGSLTLTQGTFTANNKNVTFLAVSSNNANTRTINMGSGTWTLTGTGTVWTTFDSTNLTFNPSTSTIVLSDTSATARTFAGGGLTYNNLVIGGTTGTSTLTFTGSNTFNTISSTKTVAHTILFTASTTTTVTNFTVSGTSGNVVTIGSVTAASHTLAKAGGGTITVDYASISRSTATPATTWYATNSTDGGNNSGWTFGAAPPTATNSGRYFLLF